MRRDLQNPQTIEHPIGDHGLGEETVGYRRVDRAAWSPAQLVALGAGLLLAILGGIGLARTGLAFHNIPATRTQVAGLHLTSLSAAIELGVGVVLLAVGATPGMGRASMAWLGALLFGVGIVISAQPSAFHKWLGYDSGNGVFAAIVGGLVLISAMLSPVLWSGYRRVARHRVTEGW